LRPIQVACYVQKKKKRQLVNVSWLYVLFTIRIIHQFLSISKSIPPPPMLIRAGEKRLVLQVLLRRTTSSLLVHDVRTCDHDLDCDGDEEEGRHTGAGAGDN
jgi:hypothetical protein